MTDIASFKPSEEQLKTEMERLRKYNFTHDELCHYAAMVSIKADILFRYKAVADLERQFLDQVLEDRKNEIKPHCEECGGDYRGSCPRCD